MTRGVAVPSRETEAGLRPVVLLVVPSDLAKRLEERAQARNTSLDALLARIIDEELRRG